MIRHIWNWVRQTPLVRYPLKAVTSAKRLPLIQPAPIVVNKALYGKLEKVVSSYCPGLAKAPLHIDRFGTGHFHH